MDRPSMQTPLAKAMGLGSAKSGVAHWWAQRVSAIALVPLTLWFAASIIVTLRRRPPCPVFCLTADLCA